MTRYDITLSGCDDSTLMPDVELTATEHAVVARLAALSEATSTYGCEPRMSLVEAPVHPGPSETACTVCWESFGNLTPELPVRDRKGEWVHFACLPAPVDANGAAS